MMNTSLTSSNRGRQLKDFVKKKCKGVLTILKYGFHDMYSGGFYPYKTSEEHWAYWSRYIEVNCYQNTDRPVYENLYELVKDTDYFIITTNVDHCFQKELIPKCPVCGKPLTINVFKIILPNLNVYTELSTTVIDRLGGNKPAEIVIALAKEKGSFTRKEAEKGLEIS